MGATPPPQIYRVSTRPLCAQLKNHIMPAVGMMLENDRTVGKAPPIFKDYVTTAYISDPGKPGAYDTTNYDSPGRTMALQHMEMLVTPLAQNVLAVQKILQQSSLAQPSGYEEDDKELQQIRVEMLKVLAMQSVSLDLINGFVTTQQLGDMQHAGEEYINSIEQPDESKQHVDALATPTANPAFQDVDQPGLPQNPYFMDLANVPGLQVGYNKVSVVADGLQWVQGETTSRENAVASSISRIASICSGKPLPGSSAPP